MSDELSSTVIFDVMRDEIRQKSADLKKIKGRVVFRITVDDKVRKVYCVDTINLDVFEVENEKEKGLAANALVTVADEDFVKLVLGDIDAVQGFMSGKVKVRGDILMLQKLNTVLKSARKSLL
ncbi:unnamed protein product [Caenorhabditis angaria]|uniref:SCP2 domain-containing protein n=1 Tax=Caenorhabditis angaria TaxID=860376 RepID=A0A9P1IFB7_9PELO|nr:unnamed protein product [Caenorhabditis angaria]